MSRFNQRRPERRPGTGPIKAEATTTNHAGGNAYALDPKSELLTLGVTNFVGQDTFYESAEARDGRYNSLVRLVALEDPEWLAGFLVWLRVECNMRTAALTGAAEAVHERITRDRAQAGDTHYNQELSVTNERGYVRRLVGEVLQRPDEPAEFLAYWKHAFGATGPLRVPTAVKRGIADAMRRMGNEKNFLKYDSSSRAFRWGDLLNLVHPKPRDAHQSALFRVALDSRYGNPHSPSAELPMLMAREELTALPVEKRREVLRNPEGAELLRAAGMTWEAVAGWLQGPMDAEAWECVLPNMPYMARLRNLRNFDEAGISRETADHVARFIADPLQVERSRQLPYRFLSAYLATDSDQWRQPLCDALDHSTRNIPAFGGRTLVLVDMSGSMLNAMSSKSQMTRLQAAALFGVALAKRGEDVDLHGFANGSFRHDVPPGSSVLRQCESLMRRVGERGHGTEIVRAVNETYRQHDRVVLLSDEQTFDESGTTRKGGSLYPWASGARPVPPKPIEEVVPAHVPFYAFNLGGYGTTVVNVGNRPNRHQLGGLSDATFKMVPLLERGDSVSWPWEAEGLTGGQ